MWIAIRIMTKITGVIPVLVVLGHVVLTNFWQRSARRMRHWFRRQVTFGLAKGGLQAVPTMGRASLILMIMFATETGNRRHILCWRSTVTE